MLWSKSKCELVILVLLFCLAQDLTTVRESTPRRIDQGRGSFHQSKKGKSRIKNKKTKPNNNKTERTENHKTNPILVNIWLPQGYFHSIASLTLPDPFRKNLIFPIISWGPLTFSAGCNSQLRIKHVLSMEIFL